MFALQNFINGKLRDAESGTWLDNIEPATGKVYSRIPRSGAEDVALAVDAAKRAYPAWAATSIEERSACLLRLAEAVAEYADEWAQAEARDNGKPVALAKEVDMMRSERNLAFFATAIQHFASEAHIPSGPTHINYTHRKPIGVVGCISPWNLPLYLFTWKVAPALASGNCVVAKPSEVTPMTAYLLSTCIEAAGFPPGVFNIVHGLGPEAGEAIVTHPDIKALSFTGGTATGAHIQRATAGTFKKLSLELGGKNAAIVFADADLKEAVRTTVRSSFANQGQICLCSSRILVERSIYEEFRDQLVEKARRMTPGDPLADGTKMGAVVSQVHRDKILLAIDRAVADGGRILAGGAAAPAPNDRCKDGYFVQPTVIEGVPVHCNLNQQEVFGPVISLMPFDTEEEALALANSTEYGLSATLWTQNLKRAHRVAAKLETGIVWVNCWLIRDLRTPFGGVKSSGVGREGGFEALRFFTEPQNVCVQL
jgi:aminomuconate-semialdehyde/2-hydroxymuconate-6-semialdehyde dehydrogenase